MDNLQNFSRSSYCGDLRISDAGKTVRLCGWVQRQRDLGGLIFVDLRDRTGLVQLSFDDSTDKAIFEKAASLRSEYVVAVTGLVRERESKTNKIATGDIEVYVTELRLLAKSETPPFEIVENSNANDMLRLKYRYLDLRRPEMQHAIATRHKITKVARDYFDENGFLEIETPVLTKSTPEGARDYLVPSRVHPGQFYALPQSPQQYKQLLMLSGFDRYFQIARCFRDEDLRADRQPEFTQIDLEMSFVNEDDIMTIQEGFLKRVFKEVLDVDVQTPFQRMPWQEAMDRFGSDKPDLRFGFELKDISDIVKDCGFGVFSGPVAAGGSVRLINIEGGAAAFPRKKIDKLGDFAKTYRAKGLAWARLHEGSMTSSYAKFLSDTENAAILERAGAKDGDLVLIVGDEKNTTVWAALGALRCEIAKQMGLIDPKDFKFLWVTEFPMFEYSEEEGRYQAMHHPFTSHGGGRGQDPHRQGQLPRPRLRHRPQRLRAGRRLHPYQHPRDAGEGLPGSGHLRRGHPGALRPPGWRLQVRRSSPRRPGLRIGPPLHADGRRSLHPRRYRLPQGAERLRPDDVLPRRGGDQAAGRAAHRSGQH